VIVRRKGRGDLLSEGGREFVFRRERGPRILPSNRGGGRSRIRRREKGEKNAAPSHGGDILRRV